MWIKKNKWILICLSIILIIISSFCIIKDFHLKYFEEEIEIEVGSPFLLQEFDVCYGNLFSCEKADFKMISENINTSNLGNYKIKYKLMYQNKAKEITQEINIVDTTPPNIEVEESEIMICPNNQIPDIAKKAIDNLDGDISEHITEKIENQELIFQVSDISGNIAEKRIPVKVEDNEFPKITLNGEKYLFLKQNNEYKELGAEALDNCDGNITDKIKITGSVNSKEVGEYHIIYEVEDSSGNKTNIERIVTVQEEKKYVSPIGKNIYLTFDDGPSAYTGNLLDILKKYNVKVTFFVTNQGLTKGYDHFIKRAFEEGHTIGLHTDTHNYKNIYQSETAYFEDLYAIQKKVKDITGYESKIIRFPGGSSNTISKFNPGIMSRLSKEVEQKGFRYFDWNLDSDDAGSARNSSKVSANVIKGLGNGNNYVVLQHDIKKYSVEAVEAIIQYGLSHGYQFRNLTMDSPNMHHHINN